VIGSLITFLTGVMGITTDRIGWFVLASTVGFAWITVSEYLILPDNPVRSFKRSIDVSAGPQVTRWRAPRTSSPQIAHPIVLRKFSADVSIG
jgi:hypothetical protein